MDQATKSRILFIERELLDDDIDLALNVFAQVAMIGSELRDQAGERAVLVVERKLFKQLVTLRAQLLVDSFLQRREQSVRLLRVEHFHERAVAPDVRNKRPREQRVLAVDEPFDQRRQLAVLRHEPLHPVGKPTVLRIKILLELVFKLVVNRLLVLVQSLLQSADELIALAAEDVGTDLTADVPQRKDADLERFDRVLIAGIAFRIFRKCANHVAIVYHELEQNRQLAALGFVRKISLNNGRRSLNRRRHDRSSFFNPFCGLRVLHARCCTSVNMADK
jgi:hypothetical protein